MTLGLQGGANSFITQRDPIGQEAYSVSILTQSDLYKVISSRVKSLHHRERGLSCLGGLVLWGIQGANSCFLTKANSKCLLNAPSPPGFSDFALHCLKLYPCMEMPEGQSSYHLQPPILPPPHTHLSLPLRSCCLSLLLLCLFSQGRPQLPNISGCTLLLPLKRDPQIDKKNTSIATVPLPRQAISLFLGTSGTNCFIILGSSEKQNSYHTASALPKPSLVSAWEDVETQLAFRVYAGADLVS